MNSKDREAIISWAKSQADELMKDMRTHDTSSGSTWWVSQTPASLQLIDSRAVSALEFLRLHAGKDSQWYERASEAFSGQRTTRNDVSGSRMVGNILLEWATHVENGSFEVLLIADGSPRSIVATDLMEQVRVLNEDSAVHIAAPMMLAGAAVEIALRDLLERHDLVASKPGMSAMGGQLKTKGILSKQDIKDLEQIAGLRNLAAHGNFDELTRERSGLMEQQVNLFLARLAESV